jgi:hypothetical protein
MITTLSRRLACVSALLLAGACTLAPGVASADQSVGTLGSGHSVFWDGAYVSSGRVPDPSLCGVAGPCIDYKLNVSGAAKVLRVALRTADESNNWGVVLINPAGQQVASGTTYTLGGLGEDFDLEQWAHNPAPGTWTIEVVPENVQNGSFQMRAAVDPPRVWPASDPGLQVVHSTRTVKSCHASHKGGHKTMRCARSQVKRTRITARQGVYAVPPDLAADAPWSLTFNQPLPMVAFEYGNVAAAVGVHNANTSVAGQQTYDCLPEETVEQNAHRCLRFSSGFTNLGPGQFQVYGSSPTPVAPNGGPLYQVVYRSNGTSYSRPAGSYVFHEIHAHYHVLGIAQFQIFRVVEPGKLVSAGTVLKEGFCLGDLKVFNWYSFAQGEIDPNSPNTCEPSPQPDGTWRFYEGVDPGWEDVYTWQTSGQIVDFGNNPDGYYVLRVTVNPYHYMLEADSVHDTNNVAYTYFKVTGNDIRMLERGMGSSPWDPSKRLENPVFGENPPG